MSETKTGGSRSGSKTNLNESTLPLLDEEERQEKGETPEKENIELKEKGSTGSGAEKDDSSPEKKEEKEEDEKTETEGESEEKGKKEKKKKKKEKKPKEKKAKCENRAASCVQTLSVGLNLLDRDDKNINSEVNLNFEDVLAEPDASHGFDGLWQLTYIIFTGTKFWVYRLLSALLALPCAIVWGIIFSLLTFLYVWLITPILKIIDVILYFFRRVWTGIIRTTVEPFTSACGLLCSNIHITKVSTKAVPTSVTMETV